MARVSESVYTQFYESVLTMAGQDGGVSRKEIMDKTGLSRLMADGVINRLKLKKVRSEGRLEFFGPGKATAKVAESNGLTSPAYDASAGDGDDEQDPSDTPETTDDVSTDSSTEGEDEPEKPAPASSTSGDPQKTRATIAQLLEKAAKLDQQAIEARAAAKALETVLANNLLAASS